VWTVHHGDCVDVIATLPPQSIDAVITSPPYAMQRAATYGGVPEAEYPAWTVAWMEQVRRVLKPNGSVVINIRPHVRNGQISDYTLRTRLALREAGWCEVDELIWFKRSAPPTGSPRKPRRSWESLHWFALHGQPWSDAKAAGKAPVEPPRRRIAARAERQGWDHGLVGGQTEPAIARVRDVVEVNLGRHSQWDEANAHHPAPYPWQLAEWIAKLVCPPGGVVLDPFSGGASTGVAAVRNGWGYVGIEVVAEYAAMSRRRLGTCQPPLDFGVA
jgi:site-specific DNA-methyltransferase (adenine-specific)